MADDSREVTLADHRRLAEFRYRIRRFLAFSEAAARAVGLEPQQHQVLLAATGLPDGIEPSIGVLAERLQIQHHSAVSLVDRLEERNLVQRVRGEEDHRQVFVRLTPTGETLLRELSRHHLAELRASGPLLVQALTAVLTAADSGNPHAAEHVTTPTPASRDAGGDVL
jgi:DNA-binding MarR family transcriptional regulator